MARFALCFDDLAGKRVAAQYGSPAVIRLLVRRGAGLEARVDGATPLFWAVVSVEVGGGGAAGRVRALLAARADVNSVLGEGAQWRGYAGRRPLDFARRWLVVNESLIDGTEMEREMRAVALALSAGGGSEDGNEGGGEDSDDGEDSESEDGEVAAGSELGWLGPSGPGDGNDATDGKGAADGGGAAGGEGEAAVPTGGEAAAIAGCETSSAKRSSEIS